MFTCMSTLMSTSDGGERMSAADSRERMSASDRRANSVFCIGYTAAGLTVSQTIF